ncbi:Dabb family protein [Roseibacillus ishigakijimensis]|uniref:Dabb family protein n=1 Tax=Roseibacillus ishigakijimensis TaxID=454146 RepID=A0A934RLS0_9BACT|nr:Dabb family protein [Roseibacillus ishigakijimensis]MBK1833729.1 Dabb family protein [Roseibacillus ishigakijimensis]
MKHILFCALFALFSTFAFADHHGEAASSPFRHIVMVKFKEETTEAQIKKIEEEFGKLEDKIEAITDYEWGHAVDDGRGMAQGFTHCFVVTFADKAGLEAYLPHEAHQEFVALFKPQIDKILVLDFVAK